MRTERRIRITLASERRRRAPPPRAVTVLLLALTLIALSTPCDARPAPAGAAASAAAAAAADAGDPAPAAASAPASRVSATPDPDSDGDLVPLDPNFKTDVQLLPGAMKNWTGFLAQIPRLTSKSNIQGALARAAELEAQPIPATPTNPIIGKCVPFKPPAPYKSQQDYARALRAADWKMVKNMFKSARAYSEGMGVRGCCSGIIAGDNLWATVAKMTPLGDSWSGKCIEEDEHGVPFRLTNAILPFRVNSRDWRRQRLPGDKMAPASVSLGTSWLDGQPAWVFDYSKVSDLFLFFVLPRSRRIFAHANTRQPRAPLFPPALQSLLPTTVRPAHLGPRLPGHQR
jgi:hypothetical protein